MTSARPVRLGAPVKYRIPKLRTFPGLTVTGDRRVLAQKPRSLNSWIWFLVPVFFPTVQRHAGKAALRSFSHCAGARDEFSLGDPGLKVAEVMKSRDARICSNPAALLIRHTGKQCAGALCVRGRQYLDIAMRHQLHRCRTCRQFRARRGKHLRFGHNHFQALSTGLVHGQLLMLCADGPVRDYLRTFAAHPTHQCSSQACANVLAQQHGVAAPNAQQRLRRRCAAENFQPTSRAQ